MSDLDRFTYVSKPIGSEAEMAEFAGQIAEIAGIGDVLLLDGELGAGKSYFSRQFINHLAQAQFGKKIDVPSPTFTLVQIYDQFKIPIWHFDLYRLSLPEEAYELGLDDALKTAICLIEWPSRLEGDIPLGCLTILFKHDGEQSRNLELVLNADWAKRLEPLLGA